MEDILLQVLITTERFPQLTIIKGKIKNRYSRKKLGIALFGLIFVQF
jgi:hypothetical protein